MPLAAGARLGPYEIIAPLGAGGMGEVYRARDTRIGREVALKVLPADLEEDPERRRRFHQEAVAAGNLNHPNVLTVYDVANDEGRPFLVTELLHGRSLRELLRAGPVRDAVRIAAALLDGLAAAHANGIIHRDIKPENIFITDDGTVKVLDFGLAKMPAGWQWTGASAATSPGTSDGVLLGSVGYMAPEQITGGAVDHRVDLFSAGVVLYELVVGQAPFQGPSAIETLNAIVVSEPSIPATLAAPLQPILRRALEKQPSRRFQAAADFAFALRTAEQSGSAAARSRPGARRWFPIAASVVALAALAAVALLLFERSHAPVDPTSVTLHRLTFQAGKLWSARFLPGGESVVYSATWNGQPNRLYSARIDFPAATDLALPPADLLGVSRSGEMALLLGNRSLQMGEPSSGVLARAATAGSAPREILDNVAAADWMPDGDRLAAVHDLGHVRRLELPIGHSIYETTGWMGPIRVAPDGQHVAFGDHPFRNDDRGDLVVADISGQVTRLARGSYSVTDFTWSPDAHEVWFSTSEGIVAYTLNGKRRVVFRDNRAPGILDVGPDGRVLIRYQERRVGINARLEGAQDESDLTWFDFSVVTDITPDGRNVLFYEAGEIAPERYMVALRRAGDPAPVRLGEGRAMSLSRDGKWALATYFADPPQLMMLPTGTGQARRVAVPTLADFHWATFHPDGAHLIVFGNEKGRGSRIYVTDLEGRNLRAIGPEGTLYMWNAVSPDGTLLAALDPDHRVTVYSLRDGAGRPVAGTEADEQPVAWGADASVLFVRTRQVPSQVFRIDLGSGARTFVRELMPRDATGVARIAPVVIAPDGRAYAYTYGRFLSTLYVATGLH